MEGPVSRQAAQTTIETPLAWACLAYAAAAVALFPGTYVALGTPYAATLVRTLPPMLLFGLAVAAMVARPAAPFAFIRELWGRRCRGAAGTVVVFFIGMTAFSTFKHHLPPMAGFYADPWLADLDEALHGGPAWARAHAVAPDGAGAVLFWLYGPVWFAQWFGFVLFAAFLPRDRLRARYLLSFAATLFVLGTLTAAAAASGGPILYDRIAGSERFAALLASLGADPYGGAMLRASDYLFASYLSGSGVFGNGISAMPSIHVAAATLNALLLASLDRRLGLVGLGYAGAILFGSVYFGWHYALDGYVSIAGVLAIWGVAGLLTGRRAQDRRVVTSAPV
jgi:PAP2 superfamily